MKESMEYTGKDTQHTFFEDIREESRKDSPKISGKNAWRKPKSNFKGNF